MTAALGEHTSSDVAHQFWSSALANKDAEVWLLRVDGRACGFADMQTMCSPVFPYRRAVCQFMYVKPGYSAAPLMLRLRRYARENGTGAIELSCSVRSAQEHYWTTHGCAPVAVILRGRPHWIKDTHG